MLGGQSAATEVLREKCGAPLREACLRCGELCAGENYCGGCGANLVEIMADAVDKIENDFRDVAEMRADCRFDHAIARLISIGKHVHPRLAGRCRPGETAYPPIVGRGSKRRAEIEEDCRRARRLLDAFDIEVLCASSLPCRRRCGITRFWS